MTDVQFVARAPRPALAGAIREVWLLRDAGAFCTGLPKPYVEVILSLRGVHWWRPTRVAPEHRYTEGWVTPLQNGPRHARAIGGRTLIGARLEPWAAQAWLGRLPPGDGAPPPVIATFGFPGIPALRRALIDAPDDETRLSLYESWFAQFAALRAPERPRFRMRAGARVGAMAGETSERTMRRWFADRAGVSPKRWLRLHRLDGVLRDATLRNPSATLAAVAADHGYADQAHLAREIDEFAGATASRLRQREAHLPPHYVPGL